MTIDKDGDIGSGHYECSKLRLGSPSFSAELKIPTNFSNRSDRPTKSKLKTSWPKSKTTT